MEEARLDGEMTSVESRTKFKIVQINRQHHLKRIKSRYTLL